MGSAKLEALQAASTQRTRALGLTNLVEELLLPPPSTPGLARVLRILDQAADLAADPREAGLARRLDAFLCDLHEDDMELCLEDLDVLLDGVLGLEVGDAGAGASFWSEPLQEPCTTPRIRRGRPEPLHRPSGLMRQLLTGQQWIVLPALDTHTATDAVLEDLRLLAQEPSPKHWVVDLTSCRRCPVRLLSTLIELTTGNGLRVQLAGLPVEDIGAPLITLLARHFEID